MNNNMRIDKKLMALGLLSACMLLESGTQSFAADTSNNNEDFPFDQQASLTDKELDEMRGGFITQSGMFIDFTFSANTFVDGELINQVVLNTANPNLNTENLKNIIQVGEGNSVFGDSIDVEAIPEVLTIIQNNIDNLTIQQVNLFDLTVNNIDSYIQQSVSPEIDFQNTLRLVP